MARDDGGSSAGDIGGFGEMPIDLVSGFNALDRGLELLPRVIVAPLLLGGPTLLWLLYRFLVRPGTVSQRHQPPDLSVWICAACASLTPVGQTACYRCRAERAPAPAGTEGDAPATAPIVAQAPPPVPAEVGVPVGPGRPAQGRPAKGRRAQGRPAPGRPVPSPIALAPLPPAGDGPVFSPPSRVRVSGRRTAGATPGADSSPTAVPETSRQPAATARRRPRQP